MIEQYSPGQTNDPVIIRDNRVDGLFIIGARKLDDPLLEILRTRNIPIVAIGQPSERFDSVLADNGAGIFLATEYLLERGYRRIALVNCAEQYFSNRDRCIGYETAMRKHGLRSDPCLVTNSESNTGEAGYRATCGLLDAAGVPEAIIGANASVTMGVYRCLYERGLRVPQDVSLIGQDDCVLYGYHTPAITAIDIRKGETAKRATELMLDNIATGKQGTRQILITPTVKSRESVFDRTIKMKNNT